MTPDQLALLGDERLTAEARAVGAVISMAGDDGVTYPDLEAVFPQSSRNRLRRSIQLLERTEWVMREAGGRGHSDRFHLLEFSESATYSAFRVAILGNLTNRVPETSKLNGYSVRKTENLTAPITTTTKPPPPPKASEDAKAFVSSCTSLVGCRDALCDYLGERVEVERQLAYAQAVAGIIEGTDEAVWMAPDGGHQHDDRPKIVAGCLNELRSGNEIGKYFPGPPGDIGNLRSKVKYKVRSLAGAAKDKPSKSRRSGPLFPEAEAGAA